MKKPRLLIVSPGFHGYYGSVARAFEKLGYDVTTYCYDVVTSPAEKAWNKVRHELPAKLLGTGEHQSAETASRRAIQAVRDARPDVILVIRGDVLTSDFWEAAALNGRPIAVWMYDEMRRTAFDANLVAQFARIASYSPLDVHQLQSQGVEALHVPLGYDDTITRSQHDLGAGLVSFIGAPSAKRQGALEALQWADVPVKAWGRGWSDHPVDRARTWRLRSSGIPNGRDVPGEMAHSIMRNSLGTLNIHGDQDGFTMRTFEAAGCGAVQLIDRADVVDYYEPGGELLVFENAHELVDLAVRLRTNPGEFAGIRTAAHQRTIGEHTLLHRAQALETLWKA